MDGATGPAMPHVMTGHADCGKGVVAKDGTTGLAVPAAAKDGTTGLAVPCRATGLTVPTAGVPGAPP